MAYMHPAGRFEMSAGNFFHGNGRTSVFFGDLFYNSKETIYQIQRKGMYGNRSSIQVLPFMRELKKDRREAIEQFFQNAPDWLLESFRVVELDKNVVFIRENQPVDTVHIIARGMFKITDYRVYGIAYDFMQFDGINAMGGMELIMDMDTYQATLQTITPCTSIRIPADVYARWLRTDIRALKQEAKIMGQYLYEQGVTSRTYMFVPGTDRLAVLLNTAIKNMQKTEN